MSKKVVVKYKFDAQAEGELSVEENQICALIDDSIGSGWWMLQNSRGETGLVPTDFVEAHDDDAKIEPSYDQWDDWDDSESDEHSTAPRTPRTTSTSRLQSRHPSLPVNNLPVNNLPANALAKANVIRKTFKASFCKSGGEEFFLSTDPCEEKDAQAWISPYNGVWCWVYKDQTYTCTIDDFKKDAKFKGIKSYIVYSIRPSFTSRQVYRRYKQFYWLHGVLESKFPCVIVPPLPERSVTNRFEEEFVSDRRRLLQRWLDRIARHPVLARSHVIQHFLTCTHTDEKKWKQGKREAENDKLQAGRFYMAIHSPENYSAADNLNSDAIDRYSHINEKSSKHLLEILNDVEKHTRTDSFKNFRSMASVCDEVCQSLAKDPSKHQGSFALKDSIDQMGKMCESIGKAHVDLNNTKEADNLLDILREYDGLNPELHKLSTLSRSVTNSLDEGNRAVTEDKLSPSDNEVLREKASIIGRSVIAEIHHHSDSRYLDWSKAFAGYLREKASFYRQLSVMLDETADSFTRIIPNP